MICLVDDVMKVGWAMKRNVQDRLGVGIQDALHTGNLSTRLGVEDSGLSAWTLGCETWFDAQV